MVEHGVLGISGSYGSSVFNFLRDFQTVIAPLGYTPPAVNTGPFFPPPTSLASIATYFLDDSHSDWSLMMLQSSFALQLRM